MSGRRRLILPLALPMALTIATSLCVPAMVAGASVAPAPRAASVVAADVAAQLAAAGPHEPVTVIVHLRRRAVLPAPVGTQQQRVRAVVAGLRATAAASQGRLQAFLLARRAQGLVGDVTALWIVNGLVVTTTPGVIDEIARRHDVERITSDVIDVVPTGVPSAPAEPNVAAIGAEQMWAAGNDGQGVLVASLDSGVDAAHPALAGRWRGGANSWFDPYGQHPTVPTDLTGHGTATMGAMVGGGAGGTTIGVAPGATWISARVFNDAGAATASAIHLALQWVLDPDGNPATADAPSIVNNSWAFGSPGCNLEFQADLQALRAASIVPVFAAGNYGPTAGSSVSPANYPEALSVGAVTTAGTTYSASSRGPAGCGEPAGTYPDVVAPGVNIWTSDRNGLYAYWSGTSLSAPAAAGALALLEAYRSGSTVTPEAALLATAVDLGVAGADNAFGRGRIDVAAAAQLMATGPPPTTTTTTSTTTTTTTTTTSATTPPTTTTTAPTTTTTAPTTTTTPPTTTTTAPPPTVLFADGFESGSTAAWGTTVNNAGRLVVSSAAALDGTFGLSARLGSATPIYVADTSPVAERSYHGRFRFDPNGIGLSGTAAHDLFRTLSATGSTVTVVQLRRSNASYQVRAGTLLPNGFWKFTTWTAITDAPHTLEIAWAAASAPSRGDGSLAFWIDGVSRGSTTKLTNGSQRIEEARLGPQGLANSSSGSELFDDFVSTRTTYVGV